jgi:hypothetical protein
MSVCLLCSLVRLFVHSVRLYITSHHKQGIVHLYVCPSKCRYYCLSIRLSVLFSVCMCRTLSDGMLQHKLIRAGCQASRPYLQWEFLLLILFCSGWGVHLGSFCFSFIFYHFTPKQHAALSLSLSLSLFLSLTHSHTRTYTHTHTCSSAVIHTHRDTLTYTHTLSLTHKIFLVTNRLL